VTDRAARRAKWCQWVHRQLGLRGECLAILGVADFAYAWSLFTANPEIVATNGTYRWVIEIAPLDFWGALWLLAGVACLAYSVQRYDRVGFMAAIGIKVLWGTLTLGGAIFDRVSVGFVGLLFALAGLVWRISVWREPADDSDDEA
jgi:hypothetical protein